MVLQRLDRERARAAAEFRQSVRVPSFILEDVLPVEHARAIYEAFPPPGHLVLKRTLGQLKYVGYQMDTYDPLLTEAIYAFQDPRIVRAIGGITGLTSLLPDDKLYAGGISLMTKGSIPIRTSSFGTTGPVNRSARFILGSTGWWSCKPMSARGTR